jgi:exodeoxyribonuclease-5
MLNLQQESVIKDAINWYYNEKNNNLFLISGSAGTGKTYITKILIDILGLNKNNVVFSAYTGKATLLLRQQGLIAQTIHKTFYNIVKLNTGKFNFYKKKSLPFYIDLIVIDEFSMLNDKIISDILSFNIKIIALGDENQLPPIIGKNSYMIKDNINFRLTEIMRQAKDSPILFLANKAINNEYIKPGNYDNCIVGYLNNIKNLLDYDVILTYKNSTRRSFNKIIRNKLEYDKISKYPIKNEKLICLHNNYFHEIDYLDIKIFPLNGLSLISLSDAYNNLANEYFNLKYKPEFIDNSSYFFKTKCKKNVFDIYNDINVKYIEKEGFEALDDIVELDYGHAITVHKSQGSQFNNVLLFIENGISKDIYWKYVYTGITRAKQRIDIIYLNE